MDSRKYLSICFQQGLIMVIPKYLSNDMVFKNMTSKQLQDYAMERYKRGIIETRCVFIDDMFYTPLKEANQYLIDCFDLVNPETGHEVYGDGTWLWMFNDPQDQTLEDFVLDILETWICKQKNLLCGLVHSREETVRHKTLKEVCLFDQIVAVQAGVPVETIRAIKKGERSIETLSARELLAVAKACKVSPYELIDIELNPEPIIDY